MRNLKKYIFIGMTALLATSCSDFLDTAPKDALSPVSTWQTQEDADKFLVGCYNNWQDQYNSGWGWDGFLLYWDGTSDFGYDQFPWEGYTAIGNGTLTASSGRDWYDFSRIRRVNELLANVDKCNMPRSSQEGYQGSGSLDPRLPLLPDELELWWCASHRKLCYCRGSDGTS